MSQIKNPSVIFDYLDQNSFKTQKLARSIQELSNYFIQKPDDKTPWHDKDLVEAYRFYYLPLNFIRNENVIQRGLQVQFFQSITTTIDWGCGPGTASLALAHSLKNQIEKQILIDQSSHVIEKFNDLKKWLIHPTTTSDLNLKKSISDHNIQLKNSLLVFSYSLTEMNELPLGYDLFENLMILEPSTQDDGRKLLALRETLIKEGYFLWAPCLHQNSCPLLNLTKNDWCHDRFHVQAPDWFLQIENELPFKNKTITTSYLLASKRKPNQEILQNKMRTTGDSRLEKGKTRQMICRSSTREFLTWMHKEIEPEVIPRGELIEAPLNFELKSNEIRVKKN